MDKFKSNASLELQILFCSSSFPFTVELGHNEMCGLSDSVRYAQDDVMTDLFQKKKLNLLRLPGQMSFLLIFNNINY